MIHRQSLSSRDLFDLRDRYAYPDDINHTAVVALVVASLTRADRVRPFRDDTRRCRTGSELLRRDLHLRLVPHVWPEPSSPTWVSCADRGRSLAPRCRRGRLAVA